MEIAIDEIQSIDCKDLDECSEEQKEFEDQFMDFLQNNCSFPADFDPQTYDWETQLENDCDTSGLDELMAKEEESLKESGKHNHLFDSL